MKPINPYNPEQFKEQFSSTAIFKQLEKDFQKVLWEKYTSDLTPPATPRDILGTSMFTACSFYYLKYLTDLNPTTIYDIGCGSNWFKRYIPNIIGIDNDQREGPDVTGTFDADFVSEHEGAFESAFAINSLHFIPIYSVNDRIQDFARLIKPGGRGFITFNSLAVYFSTPVDKRIELELHNPDDCIKIIDTNLDLKDLKILVYDVKEPGFAGDETNGDIRIVFEKPRYTRPIYLSRPPSSVRILK